MLTTRGWWFLLILFLLFVVAVPTEQPQRFLAPERSTLSLLALTLLLWFLGQWLLFAVRSRLVVPHVSVERTLFDERGPVETLWAGRVFEVQVRLHLQHALSLPHVAVADWVPFGVELLEGDTVLDGPLSAEQPLELRYRVRCTAAGQARFEGVRLHLADFQGFFVSATFLPALVVYRVLPGLADDKGHVATHKRHNLLPPPGVHRLRRPGSGSELLDLRDYLPGDPPRTIAWKVSARRDRLITKEFESEVPLRCTLFVDTSNSVRVGGAGRNALARLLHIAAAAAQANSAARDLTGLCLFDEHEASMLRPARTGRHLAELLNRLTEAANLAPTTPAARVETLLPLAYSFAQEVYPYLLRPALNHVPFWLPWLWRKPAERLPRRTVAGQIAGGVLWFLYLLPFVGLVGLLGGALDLLYNAAHDYREVDEFLPVPEEWLFAVLVLGLWFLYPYLMTPLGAVLSGLFAWRQRRLARWRKQLAALLSVRYGLAPGGLGLLLEDDRQMSLHLQRFLAEHHVPYPLPLYDTQGRYLFTAPGKVAVLAEALLGAVGRGHDNELFVLLADLLELEELEPLLRAVRVALARHHQVIVVCPWPPGVPPVGASQQRTDASGAPPRPRPGLLPLLDQAATQRCHAAFLRLRHTFARLGVPVACAASDEPIPLILDRLERLRMLGRRR